MKVYFIEWDGAHPKEEGPYDKEMLVAEVGFEKAQEVIEQIRSTQWAVQIYANTVVVPADKEVIDRYYLANRCPGCPGCH